MSDGYMSDEPGDWGSTDEGPPSTLGSLNSLRLPTTTDGAAPAPWRVQLEAKIKKLQVVFENGDRDEQRLTSIAMPVVNRACAETRLQSENLQHVVTLVTKAITCSPPSPPYTRASVMTFLQAQCQRAVQTAVVDNDNSILRALEATLSDKMREYSGTTLRGVTAHVQHNSRHVHI